MTRLLQRLIKQAGYALAVWALAIQVAQAEPGLIAHWAFDEASGASALDASGNNQTASLINAPTRIAGKVNGALRFNGTNQAVNIASLTGMGFGNAPHTIAAWVKVNSLPATRAWILLYGYESAGSHHWLINSAGQTQLGSWGEAQFNPSLSVGVWQHISLTFDGATSKAYLNGVLLGAKVNSFALEGPLTLAQVHVNEEYFNGELDEVRVYNRVLSASEVASLASSTGPSNQPPTVSLTSPTHNATYTAPATIPLSATASDADGSVTKVEFYNGASLIATDTNGADGWSISWAQVPAGSYTLSAKAYDNTNLSTSSASATVSVTSTPTATNLALNRPASASSQWADACAASKANNGSNDVDDNCGGWSPSGSDPLPWWQVDLGQAYRITTLELVTRHNCCDQPETRQNFEIRASNDPSFASYVVLGSQGSTVLPFQSTWTQNVSDPNGYRYIRATKAGYFFIAELKVYGGAPAAQPNNLYYIYADHLNTPRVITDTANTVVWRNDQADPFAASLPNEDPTPTAPPSNSTCASRDSTLIKKPGCIITTIEAMTLT